MGVVYRALDTVLQRYVAVKVMTSGIARDPDLRERFLREARAAGSLQHPNIITIYDFGEVGDELFIAMEYIEGADLTQVIERRDPLPLHAKLDIILDVLNGLAYAHRRGIIHRDIKPANIRVSADGRAHIMDFGIARLSESSMTRSGMLVGTPDYMSPEQVAGSELTPASDIFAVGTVMYELLTNTKPFKAETLHSVMYKIMSEQPPPLSEVSPEAPPALQNVLSRALAKNLQDRYPSAEPMIEDLMQFRLALSGGSLATITVRRTPLRTMKPAESLLSSTRRPSPGMLAGAGIAGSVLIASLLWLGSRGDRDPATTAEGDPATMLSVAGPAQPPAGPAAPPVDTAATMTAPPAAPIAATPAAPAARAGTEPRRDRGERSRLDSMVTTMRVAAIAARSRARDAGASASDLARGERLLTSGDGAKDAGDPANALTRYSNASSEYAAVEARVRAARTAAPAVTAPPVTASSTAPAVSPPAVATEPRSAERQQPPAAAPPVVAPRDPRPDLEALVGAFAKALESLSISELRRAYPGMTSAQQSGWEQFFSSVTALDAELSVTNIDVTDAAAELRITGAYTYTGRNGKRDSQPVSFTATARREGSSWRLMSIR